VFNPSAFDAEQIVSTAAAGGMKGLILTCKHHDGFCLWPSRYTEHSVKHSPWKGGRGDVVRDISEACRAFGLKFGVYLSPWDRNHPKYGRQAYIDYYRNQLRELLTGYGPLFEIWFDGANGGDGYYGGARERREIDRHSYYEWETTWKLVRELQPEACIFSDAGPDIRWVGNESGIAGDPCWSRLDRDRFAPGEANAEELNAGHRSGSHWVPAECDVSIRPGWFYHAAEDGAVRSPDNLLDLYFQSVGKGASLLLNLPPDRRGLVHETDAAALLGFRQRLQSIFAANLAQGAQVSGPVGECSAQNLVDGSPDTYWSADGGAAQAEVVLEFPAAVTFNIASLREHLPLGQRVDRFALDVDHQGHWQEWGSASSIGSRRLLTGKKVTTSRLRLRILEASAPPALSELALHFDAGLDE
jgi:alpha-L-fucosidase